MVPPSHQRNISRTILGFAPSTANSSIVNMKETLTRNRRFIRAAMDPSTQEKSRNLSLGTSAATDHQQGLSITKLAQTINNSTLTTSESLAIKAFRKNKLRLGTQSSDFNSNGVITNKLAALSP